MSPEREKIVLDAYGDNKTCRQIVKEYGIATNEVAAVLRKHGIKPRTGRPPTLAIDHAAFDILTPTSMYWMGFLFADGCIYDDHKSGAPQIILDIGVGDRDHLVLFRNFLKSEHAIREVFHRASTYKDITVQDRPSVAYRARSKQIADALAEQGLVAGKKKRVPSATLAQSSDFWRGCVDGDGTVRLGIDRNDWEYAQVVLCGQELLIESYRSFLRHHGIHVSVGRTASRIYNAQAMGSKAVLITRLLYADAVVALERKHAAARKIISKFGVINA